MGFGWMFLGYILLLGTNFEILGVTLDITPDVIGFLLLSHGFSVASKYCDCFKISGKLCFVGIPLSLAYLLTELAASLELVSFSPSVLLWVVLISEQTGVEKLRKNSVRLAIYTVLFCFAEHFLTTFLSWGGITLSPEKLAGAQMLLGIACILINATLIWGCYMWICLEGDEDMPDNRKHKYKTPFDYFDKSKAEEELRKAELRHANTHHKKKKK